MREEHAAFDREKVAKETEKAKEAKMVEKGKAKARKKESPIKHHRLRIHRQEETKDHHLQNLNTGHNDSGLRKISRWEANEKRGTAKPKANNQRKCEHMTC